jgi:hypothetical protein
MAMVAALEISDFLPMILQPSWRGNLIAAE